MRSNNKQKREFSCLCYVSCSNMYVVMQLFLLAIILSYSLLYTMLYHIMRSVLVKLIL